MARGKNRKYYIGIGIFVFALLVLAFFSFPFAILGQEKVYTSRYSSGSCEQIGERIIRTYDIKSSSSPELKYIGGSILGGYVLAHRCGYGDVNTKSEDKFYIGSCEYIISNPKNQAFDVFMCKNTYDYSIRPSKSNLCKRENVFGSTFTTDILYNVNGVIIESELNNKYTTLVIDFGNSILESFFSSMILEVKANPYVLKVTQGNGFSYNQIEGCSITDIMALKDVKVFPSSFAEENKFNYKGELVLAFDSKANWMWSYEEVLTANAYNHPALGFIYADAVGSYIPIKKIDGVNVALDTDRVQSKLIECLENSIGCEKGKFTKSVSCSAFKGFATGSYVVIEDSSCKYSCVNNKPTFSDCTTLKDDICPKQGEVFSVEKNKCVETSVLNPFIQKDITTNYVPFLLVIGATIVIILIMLNVARMRGKI